MAPENSIRADSKGVWSSYSNDADSGPNVLVMQLNLETCRAFSAPQKLWMLRFLQPWQLFVAILAGWINEHQQAAIEYLREENRVLKEQLGGKRLRLTDDQRRRLAAKGKALGRKALKEIVSSMDLRPDSTRSPGKVQGCSSSLGEESERAETVIIRRMWNLESRSW